MLKRQRPVSPQFSTPDIPFVNSDALPPYHKRRRTLPPVLDSQARGWGNRAEQSIDDESDDDESVTGDGSSSPSREDLQSQVAWEYKSANSLLHDLHALHQHRLIFSSSSPHRELLSDQAHRSPPDPPSREPISLASKHTVTYECPGNLSCRERDMRLVASSSSGSSAITTHTDEIECVRERYEETNKFVYLPVPA